MASGDRGRLLATTTKPDVAGAGKKRKKLVKTTRLPQGLVDEIVRRPVTTPFPESPDDLLAAGFSDECRAAFAIEKTDVEKLVAFDADDIVTQYKNNDDGEKEEKTTEENDCSSPMKKRRRKKLVKRRLPQGLVAEIVARPITPCPVIPEDLLPGFSDECRAAFAMQKTETEKLMAFDADIIRQYQAQGYAEVEEEVTDDED